MSTRLYDTDLNDAASRLGRPVPAGGTTGWAAMHDRPARRPQCGPDSVMDHIVAAFMHKAGPGPNPGKLPPATRCRKKRLASD